MKTKLFIILIVAVLLISGCSASNKIIGRWEDTDGIQYEFYRDGTITIDSYGITVSGDYEFIDKETIKINLAGLWGLAGASVMEVDISGNQMTLNEGGIAIILEKVD